MINTTVTDIDPEVSVSKESDARILDEIRALGPVRQHGWTAALLKRASVAAYRLASDRSAHVSAEDRMLGDDLLRWIAAIADEEAGWNNDGAADEVVRYFRPLVTALNRGVHVLPRVVPSLGAVLDVLTRNPQSSWREQLHQMFADPTQVLVAQIDALGVTSLEELGDEHRLILLAIGALDTPEGVRALLGWLRWHPMYPIYGQDEFAALRNAVALAPSLTEHTIALWSEVDTFPRHVLIEALGRTGGSLRVLDLLLQWLDQDPEQGADALVSYGFLDVANCFLPLRRAYDRSVAAGDVNAIESVLRAASTFGIDTTIGRTVD